MWMMEKKRGRRVSSGLKKRAAVGRPTFLIQLCDVSDKYLRYVLAIPTSNACSRDRASRDVSMALPRLRELRELSVSRGQLEGFD